MTTIPQSNLIDSYYLSEELERKKENIRHNLVSGACDDYNEYRYLVGFYEGLTESQTILEDLRKKYLSGEDLEEDAER